ncbi:hypothetical protein HK101_003655 [Irineochytrium annulatum]|nr:hypothetical protein HK101_003655 [Irineochytrium annulatum]
MHPLPPKKKELLGKQLQGKRQYFDSGDYALSKAGKAPMKEVGSQHPSPDGIPHSVPINLKSPNSASTNSPARESSLSQEANVEGTAIAAESAGGGGSGIGLALAKRILSRANRPVILVGRRAEALEAAKRDEPRFEILQGDVSTPASRLALFKEATTRFPTINCLVNNAGIQRAVDLSKGVTADEAGLEEWDAMTSEIRTNVEAPLHLSLLFLDHLRKQPDAQIVMVTSGLSFIPAPSVPIYASTKAFLHSFTWSLRHQLRDTGVKVVEIAPPAVDTDLQAPGLHKFGMPLDVFADEAYERWMVKGETEIGVGMADKGIRAYREANEKAFEMMAKMKH